MRFLLGVAVLVALVARAIAQQAEVVRMQHPGRVLDAEGKPAAAAEVTFVSGPRLGAKPTDDDVVRATSGSDGRFQMALLPGRSYMASALQRHGEVVQLTRYQPFGGTSTTLRLEAERRPAVTQWHLEGVEAWQQHGPLALQVLVLGSANVVAEVVVDAEGGAVVPSLPVGPVGVRLFARDRLVHVWEDAVAGCDLPLRPPQLEMVRVIDAAGAPVPEATIARRWQSTPSHRVPCIGAMAQVDAWPLAVTGQDGTAQVLVAQENPLQAILANGAATELSVQKEGLRLVAPPSRAGAAMQFQLGLMPVARGQVRFGKLPAQGGARFSSSGDAPWPSTFTAFDPTGGIDLVWPRRRDVRTQPWRVAWITAATPELAAGDPFRAVASPHPLLVPLSRVGAEGGLDLAEVVPVRIQVLTADGMPASGANVWSVPESDGVFAPTWQAVGRVADASGRVVVNALPGPWLVAVVHAGQLGHTVVEVAAGLRVQTLQMRTLDAVTVHVVDAEGRAVVGARVAIESDERFPRTDAREAWLQRFCANFATEQPPVATDAAGNATLQFGWPEVVGCRFAIEANLGMRVARGTLDPGAASLQIVMP